MADEALPLTVRVIDDKLNRIGALNRATSGGATSAHELGQLGAQLVVERLVEEHPHEAALVRSQAEPAVAAAP